MPVEIKETTTTASITEARSSKESKKETLQGSQGNDMIAVEDPSKASPVPVSPPFADGEWAAWSTMDAGWCYMFASLGWINSISVFQTIYRKDQPKDYSSDTTGWIVSQQTFAVSCLAARRSFEKIFDSYGPRFILLGGTFSYVFGLMTRLRILSAPSRTVNM
ncbi:hypothetical protein TMatcc_005534 [Talaromyces marneffei ATCC 18224]|uniref:Riboflavin transporter MCH5 n=1 Tax=Talaromyces marneffei PM1 TaxID=1077442 RepID=A0A093V2F7_TALMA|nr:uncharacterized protein EYB26_005932 [Talaromyces marneffei]KAE8554909.1 hypothetical protein EYB25_003456 [Talaromyces marneffei]QGA18248.1 hypothetical protein EYB26_005932 [Talaromyces marneffei]